MSDQYVEVTRQGWGSRITGSIGGMVVGVVMFGAGFPVLWWNEGRAVRTALSLEEGAAAVVSISADRIEPRNEGKLVHLTGRATTTETLSDPLFRISANALELRREVEMYQWVEDVHTEKRERLGGSEETIKTYSYQRAWRGGVIDSARFKKPEGHQNPGSMKYDSARFMASTVTLGAFTLPTSLRNDIDRTEPVAPTAEALAAINEPVAAPPPVVRKGKRKVVRRVAQTVVARDALKLSGDGFYAGVDPTTPAIGDLRIRFTRVPPTEVSVIAQQRGVSFQPYRARAGNSLQMLSVGTASAAQMFSDAEASNVILTWLLRLGGFVLMAWGVYSVLRPLAITASVIPFLGSLARTGLGLIAFFVAAPFSLVTIAVAWLFYRPLLGAALLGGAALAAIAVVTLVRKARAAAPVRMAA